MNARASLWAQTLPLWNKYANLALGGSIVVGGLALLMAMRLGWIDILPHGAAGEAAPAAVEAAGPPTSVELTPEKLAAANLHTTTCALALVQVTRSVPATIAYDAARRVPVTSPVAGVVVRVLAEPGQQLAAHQPLAELSSPEVGLARDEVQKHRAELELAKMQLAFTDEIARNVENLLALLAQKPKLDALEKALDQRTLGDYREKIVGAYSKLLLAELLVSSTDSLESGTLSKRLVDERKSSREVAAAQYAAACETARFSAAQELGKAKANAEQAERLLAVAQQSLANLLGPLADMTPVADRARLSELLLLAPIAGRVEERAAVAAARVTAGAPLFTLADISALWVSAEVHERDWKALDIAPGGEIRVRVPALAETELLAKVRFVGSQVSADSRSVPLVAELPNPDGRLKPGLFAWALLPLEKQRQALAVPEGAIMRHESQAFVFVPAGERTFRRVDVALGAESGGQIEVVSGLKVGDTVVDRGAFFLKSELLLEREE